jgi:hypothetical protein
MTTAAIASVFGEKKIREERGGGDLQEPDPSPRDAGRTEPYREDPDKGLGSKLGDIRGTEAIRHGEMFNFLRFL